MAPGAAPSAGDDPRRAWPNRGGGNESTCSAGVRIVDLGDATLLPGLIDLHTHLTGDERVHWEDALVKSTPPRDALWGARNARTTLMAGFTSVRDMGPTWPYVDVELRRAIDEGAVSGPRMMVAGNYVSSTAEQVTRGSSRRMLTSRSCAILPMDRTR
jgi:imidazolonepropionase-like amidohydrolase